MPDHDDITSAIVDLKDRLDAGEDPSGLVDEVADDWDLNPKLLNRKFTEAHKVSVENYAPVDKIALMAGASYRAMENDEHLYSLWHRSIPLSSEDGEEQGRRFIAGLVVADNSGRKIVLRSISDNQVYFFTLGETVQEHAAVRQLFGSWDRLRDLVRSSPESRLEPADFKDWAAANAGAPDPGPAVGDHASTNSRRKP